MTQVGAINVFCKICRGWQTATSDLLRNNETSNYGPPLLEREPLRYTIGLYKASVFAGAMWQQADCHLVSVVFLILASRFLLRQESYLKGASTMIIQFTNVSGKTPANRSNKLLLRQHHSCGYHIPVPSCHDNQVCQLLNRECCI